MQLATLEITPDEAKEKLAEYRSMLAEERTAEDDAIAAGYRAAARGLPLIRLSQAIEEGGYFDYGLPRIAVCPATATICGVRWEYTGQLIFGDNDTFMRNQGALVNRDTVRVQVGNGPGATARRRWNGATMVPLIPPRYRPRKRRLAHLHILWEVEAWDLTVPYDPALIRHIRGDMWAVLATWDLTPLERAVLSQRR